MKFNKKLIPLLSMALLLSTNITKPESEDHEPVLAEAVEMPGNVVGSLFGGGYAHRQHEKHKREREEYNDRDEKEMKKRKKSKKDDQQPANRRQARRQRRRSSSSDK